MINNDVFANMLALPVHQKLCRDLLEFFSQQPGIESAILSGSGAAGKMDEHSDLDFGFVCTDNTAKERIWAKRFDWKLPGWFHRMDADHVKPYFIIYLFNPHIHVDLVFYTLENLPPQAGGPYKIAFDPKNQLTQWLPGANKPLAMPPDWSNVVHEEERFWTWIHYAWCHVGRGEYYEIAVEFEFLRRIPQSWYARLTGKAQLNMRRMEQRGESAFAETMRLCFPPPDRISLKTGLLSLIAVHNSQRAEVDRALNPEWKTTPMAREKITRLVEEL